MRRRSACLVLLALCVLGVPAGCSRGGKRLELRSRADDVRIALRLPPGWAEEERIGEGMVLFSETADPQNRGSVTIYPGEGKELGAWVDTVLAQSRQMDRAAEMMGRALERMAGRKAGDTARTAFHQKTISRTSRKIGRLEGIELVEESGDKKVLTLAAKKGEVVCVVMFASLAGQWAEDEPRFRRSLDSLRIR
jgi:hypothetical protein